MANCECNLESPHGGDTYAYYGDVCDFCEAAARPAARPQPEVILTLGDYRVDRRPFGSERPWGYYPDDRA